MREEGGRYVCMNAQERVCLRCMSLAPACVRASTRRVCVCVCVCVCVQLDIMGCAASQDAMNDKSKTSNGQYSDQGVFGAEEDFPLYIDEVRRGRVWGGVRVKDQRQTERGGRDGLRACACRVASAVGIRRQAIYCIILCIACVLKPAGPLRWALGG